MALPRLLVMFLAQSASPPLPQEHASGCLAALHGATLELLSRVLAARGQEVPAPGGDAALDSGPADAAAQLDVQRQQQHQQQEAFDALLVHISAYCHMLTAPAAGLSAPAADTTLESPASANAVAHGSVAGVDSKQQDAGSGTAADASADGSEGSAMPPPELAVLLAQRAFGELAAAVTAAAAAGLGCGRAQTLLLHLLKVRVAAYSCGCERSLSCHDPFMSGGCQAPRVNVQG